ncbi:MAG: hypothetical protein QME12_05095 [Nanoarchaeota archaeon]|nr:hypothetical protein [Nanoarchaeota archaeon]
MPLADINACLCRNHPKLEPDWNFFEKIRTKRNGFDYYGAFITYEDWREVGVQVKLWLKALIKAVEDRIKTL